MKLVSIFTLLSIVLLAAYVAISWYFFGSGHPCRILEARMIPYRIEAEKERAMALERQHSQVGEATRFEDPKIRQLIEEDWQRIREAPQVAATKLHDEISRLNLFQCIHQALTWSDSKDTSAR